jgi:REP element-mobilizing transposase RayT
MILPILKPGSRNLRKGRASIPGQPYLITTVCKKRKPFFREWEVARRACATLAEPRLWRDSTLQCWVLMPDHLHLLVSLGESEDLSKLMSRVKAVTSRAAKVASVDPDTGPIWEKGFHDHALRHEKGRVDIARYIVANPIRAGIVRGVRDYPYWDALWL